MVLKNSLNFISEFLDYASRQIRKYVVREDTGLCCASRANLWRNGKRIGNKVKFLLSS